MSDDFGTVNSNRAERAREIELLRDHYRRHRETLQGLAADAPTEHLAGEYRRMVGDIDGALRKIDELETGGGAVKTKPGMKPLATPPAAPDYEEVDGDSRSRMLLIVGAAVLALAIIGTLIWRASSDRGERPAMIVEETAGATATTTQETTAGSVAEDATIEPASLNSIVVSPPSMDYGAIRKGTRATRNYEVNNRTDEPITIVVERSTCRCLYYEHAPVVPPRGKESLTVTIDGARAKAGDLRETIRVSLKSDPTVGDTFDVIATVR